MNRNTAQQWPVPYCGPMDDRTKHLGAPHETRFCANDRTGKIRYAFNALGYRGYEFLPNAKLRVFTFGESDAFGTGVEHHEAWPSRVAANLRESLGLAEHELCFMNFSEPGGSCDLMARQVITQCSAAPPDLVLINFSECLRTEGFAQGQVFNVGPWFADPEVHKQIDAIPTSEREKHPYAEALQRGQAYAKFTSIEHGFLASVRAILLAQYYLASTEILALATARKQWGPFQQDLETHSVIGPLLAQIDPEFLVAHEHDQAKIDTAAQGDHHGPGGHAAIAASVWSQLESNGTVAALRKRATDRT